VVNVCAVENVYVCRGLRVCNDHYNYQYFCFVMSPFLFCLVFVFVFIFVFVFVLGASERYTHITVVSHFNKLLS